MKDFCFGEPRCSNKVKHSAKFLVVRCHASVVEVSCVNSSSAPRKVAPTPQGASSRSHAPLSYRAHGRAPSASSPNRAARDPASFRPARRDRSPQPPPAVPPHPLAPRASMWGARRRVACVAAQWRGTRSRVFSSSAARRDRHGFLRCAVPHSRSPSALSAAPRLFCVIAQSSGTRSRAPFLQRCVIGRHRLL